MSAAELEPGCIVDLDDLRSKPAAFVRWEPPQVVDGHIIAMPYRSPLDADPVTREFPTCLRGGVVTDPVEIAAIARRVTATAVRERCAWWRTFLWRWL